MTIAGAPLASAAEQNSAYARNKEGRFGKPGRPSLFGGRFDGINGITKLTKGKAGEILDRINKINWIGKKQEADQIAKFSK